MKTILFVIPTLQVGGIEKAFINMLNDFDYTKYNVDLYLFSNIGKLLDQVPKEVNILNPFDETRALPMTFSQVIKTKELKLILIKLLGTLVAKLFRSSTVYKILFRNKKIIKEYDFAIAYSQPSGKNNIRSDCNEFILSCIKAKKIITWIHCDLENVKLFDDEYYLNQYKKFDNIITVSKTEKEYIEKKYTDLYGKIKVIYNFYNIDNIVKLSNEDTNIKKITKFKIITVARISEEKGIDRICNIIKELKEINPNFIWYIVGDGKQKQYIENIIKKYSIENHLILLGDRLNPYCLIKNSDLFVLTSRHEAMPMVIGECRILKVPCISVNYKAAKEQIREGVTGFIVDNSEEALKNKIIDVINNRYKLRKINQQLDDDYISNNISKYQLENILGDEMYE